MTSLIYTCYWAMNLILPYHTLTMMLTSCRYVAAITKSEVFCHSSSWILYPTTYIGRLFQNANSSPIGNAEIPIGFTNVQRDTLYIYDGSQLFPLDMVISCYIILCRMWKPFTFLGYGDLYIGCSVSHFHKHHKSQWIPQNMYCTCSNQFISSFLIWTVIFLLRFVGVFIISLSLL